MPFIFCYGCDFNWLILFINSVYSLCSFSVHFVFVIKLELVILFWGLNVDNEFHGSSKSNATAASSRVDFGDLFASERSSRKRYTKIFAAQLTTPSRVDLPVVKNT